MRILLLAALISSTGSSFAQNDWQHVGLAGRVPSSGLQFVDDELFFHATGQLGRLYHSSDAAQTWDSTQFSVLGYSLKYAVHDGVEYLSYYNGYSGGVRLYRFAPSNGQWQQKYLIVDAYTVLASGRLVIISGISGEKGPIRISDDHGDTWTTTFPSSGAFRFRYVGTDAEQRLLMQTYDWDDAPADSLGLWRSADEGLTWSRISAIQHDLTGASITNDGHIYCSNGKRILHSSDNGVTWDEPWNVDFVHGGFMQSSVHHLGDGRLYFMRHAAQWNDPYNLYYSTDGGHAWTAVTDEVSDHFGLNMVQDDGGNLFLATDNGVYRLQTSTSVAENDAVAGVLLAPNPAKDMVRVHAPGMKVNSVRFIDAQGRVAHTFGPTLTQRSLSLGDVKPGMYVIEIHSEEGIATSKLMVE